MDLSLVKEYVGDITMPTQYIKHSQLFLQANQPSRLQYSNQIKLLLLNGTSWQFIRLHYTIKAIEIIHV
jgi:hypothetical protein